MVRKKKSGSNPKKWKRAESPIRPSKVLELRAIRNDRDHQNDTILELLFYIFRDRTRLDDGFSRKELALVFYPRDIQTDKKTGRTVPTREAMDKLHGMLNNFRHWEENKSNALVGDILYNEVKDTYEWILHRVRTRKELKFAEKRLDQVQQGVLATKEDLIEKVTLSSRQIDRLDDELIRKIRERSRKRSKERED